MAPTSGRRISGLVEADVDPATKFAAYGEFGFLGAAQTANLNESDSFTPRVRHLYAQGVPRVRGGERDGQHFVFAPITCFVFSQTYARMTSPSSSNLLH